MGEPRVRVLYIEGCGSYAAAVEEARAALGAVGLQGEPETILVEDEAGATTWGFRGSPTVTVDGRDVDQRLEGEPGLGWG